MLNFFPTSEQKTYKEYIEGFSKESDSEYDDHNRVAHILMSLYHWNWEDYWEKTPLWRIKEWMKMFEENNEDNETKVLGMLELQMLRVASKKPSLF